MSGALHIDVQKVNKILAFDQLDPKRGLRGNINSSGRNLSIDRWRNKPAVRCNCGDRVGEA
jgi:hypothetical protein